MLPVPFRIGGVVLKRKFTLYHTSFDKERVTKYADNHCNFNFLACCRPIQKHFGWQFIYTLGYIRFIEKIMKVVFKFFVVSVH